jgi:hypothetical protein
MANSKLEAFVNAIRNLYQQAEISTSQTSSNSINYTEVLNLINSSRDVLNENCTNLIDNVLPIFTLPVFTLPNMALLYAIVSQIQQQTISNSTAASSSILNLDQEKLLSCLQSCIQQADIKQVKLSFIFIFKFLE